MSGQDTMCRGRCRARPRSVIFSDKNQRPVPSLEKEIIGWADHRLSKGGHFEASVSVREINERSKAPPTDDNDNVGFFSGRREK